MYYGRYLQDEPLQNRSGSNLEMGREAHQGLQDGGYAPFSLVF